MKRIIIAYLHLALLVNFNSTISCTTTIYPNLEENWFSIEVLEEGNENSRKEVITWPILSFGSYQAMRIVLEDDKLKKIRGVESLKA